MGNIRIAPRAVPLRAAEEEDRRSLVYAGGEHGRHSSALKEEKMNLKRVLYSTAPLISCAALLALAGCAPAPASAPAPSAPPAAKPTTAPTAAPTAWWS